MAEEGDVAIYHPVSSTSQQLALISPTVNVVPSEFVDLRNLSEWEIGRLGKYFLHELPSAEWRNHINQAVRVLATPGVRVFNAEKPRAPIWAIDSEEPLRPKRIVWKRWLKPLSYTWESRVTSCA